MHSLIASGPSHPRATIFFLSTLVAGVIGLITASFTIFMISMAVSLLIFFLFYLYLQRKLGWRALEIISFWDVLLLLWL